MDNEFFPTIAQLVRWKQAKREQMLPPVLTAGKIMTLTGCDGIGATKGFMGGSRVICDPAPTNTDRDIVVLVYSVPNAQYALECKGWFGNSEDYGIIGEEDFRSLRRGDDNIMLVSNPEEYGAILAATCIAMRMNLTEKKDRYALFETARLNWR